MDWSLDGKKYKKSDSAPIDFNECEGCDSCCHIMEDTIVQDPYDLWLFCSNMRVSGGMPVTFEILISEDGPWQLSVQNGLILPNIKMVEEGRCPFLNEKGRCSIHKIRSGLCRLFPLGRGFEEDGSITYYVLSSELGCEKLKEKGNLVNITEWLGYDDIDAYEKFTYIWHKLKKEVGESYLSMEDRATLQANFLQHFYVKGYKAKTNDEFFNEFYTRVEEWKKNG